MKCPKCGEFESFTVLLQFRNVNNFDVPEEVMSNYKDVIFNTIICDFCGNYMHFDIDGKMYSNISTGASRPINHKKPTLDGKSVLNKLTDKQLLDLLKELV